MSPLIFELPPEIFRKITLYATFGSPLGPPKELYNCLLICRTFRDHLSPKNASELYSVIFAQKFDVRGPLLRLGATVVRENASLEMQRRFVALQIFKSRLVDDPRVPEALWIAYLMVEDSDTSQKNIKQLLRAGLPSFLDIYLRSSLYDGAASNNGWPILTESLSLAISLLWTLSSQRVLSNEDPSRRQEMMNLLRPIVYAPFRYSIIRHSEDSFAHQCLNSLEKSLDCSCHYPPSIFPSREIRYFGGIQRKARPPSAALFATLLYITRMESLTSLVIPPHIVCETRQEANELGIMGPTKADIMHFQQECRTRFADFPGIDVGIQHSAKATLVDNILCQPTRYILGTLNGEWQGSNLTPCIQKFNSWASNKGIPQETLTDTRMPLYIKLEEHYCYDLRAIVPMSPSEHETEKAWLPEDLVVKDTADGMEFSDSKGTFRTTYKTLGRGETICHRKEVVDVIITGKTDDRHLAAWGGFTTIMGRIRIRDGLMVLVQSNARGTAATGKRLLYGYVTSSQNFVGRLAIRDTSLDGKNTHESVFSLNRNHSGSKPP